MYNPYRFSVNCVNGTTIYGRKQNVIIEFEWLHKTRVALFFNGARVFFLPRDQLLTHFFSRVIIFIIYIHKTWYRFPGGITAQKNNIQSVFLQKTAFSSSSSWSVSSLLKIPVKIRRGSPIRFAVPGSVRYLYARTVISFHSRSAAPIARFAVGSECVYIPGWEPASMTLLRR